MKILLYLTLSLLLTACAAFDKNTFSSAQKSDPSELYTIYIDRFGEIKKKNNDEVTVTDMDYVKSILNNFEEKRKTRPQLKMVIFVHGGLNTFENVWERVSKFKEVMISDNRYPVFVGWNSGGFSNYSDHLFHVRRGEDRPLLAALSVPFVLLEDVARSIAHLPAAWFRTIYDPVSVMKSVPISNETDYELRRRRLCERGFAVVNRPPYVGLEREFFTIWNPVKLVTAPFIDGLGAGSWDSMLRRTDLVLSKSVAFEGEFSNSNPNNNANLSPNVAESIKAKAETTDDIADTAVTALLKEIIRINAVRFESKSSLPPIEIDLIGHSMGTIVVNNILARHPSLKIDNVVFMGAAARIKDVENGVVPWMRQANNNANFYNLSLDPYREITENEFYDFLPRGTLLHWIDYIFGDINSFKDRTAGSWWNIIRTAEDVFPSDVRNRVHLTRFAIGQKGEGRGPQEHGEFDEYAFWRHEFWNSSTLLEKFKVGSSPLPPATLIEKGEASSGFLPTKESNVAPGRDVRPDCIAPCQCLML